MLLLINEINTGSKPATGPVAVAVPLKPAGLEPALIVGAASLRMPASSLRNDSWFSSKIDVTAFLYLSEILSNSECSRIGAHFSCKCSELNFCLNLKDKFWISVYYNHFAQRESALTYAPIVPSTEGASTSTSSVTVVASGLPLLKYDSRIVLTFSRKDSSFSNSTASVRLANFSF